MQHPLPALALATTRAASAHWPPSQSPNQPHTEGFCDFCHRCIRTIASARWLASPLPNQTCTEGLCEFCHRCLCGWEERYGEPALCIVHVPAGAVILASTQKLTRRVRMDACFQVLVHIYEKSEEVPLIALYRKEIAGELLSMRLEDAPQVGLVDVVPLSCRWPVRVCTPECRCCGVQAV